MRQANFSGWCCYSGWDYYSDCLWSFIVCCISVLLVFVGGPALLVSLLVSFLQLVLFNYGVCNPKLHDEGSCCVVGMLWWARSSLVCLSHEFATTGAASLLPSNSAATVQSNMLGGRRKRAWRAYLEGGGSSVSCGVLGRFMYSGMVGGLLFVACAALYFVTNKRDG